LTIGPRHVPVIESVFMDESLVSGSFAVSAAGTVAYVPGKVDDFKRRIVNLSDSARPPIINEQRAYREFRVSPDGGRIAVVESAWRDRIWVVDTGRQSFTRLATGRYLSESDPVWSPDGRFIAFRAVSDDNTVHLYVAPSNGSAPERLVWVGVGEFTPNAWTPDGRSLLVTDRKDMRNGDIMFVDVAGSPAPRPAVSTRFDESAAALSPDGRWLAFRSNRSGQYEIYVSPYPPSGDQVQVSFGGGATPVWATNSRQLFFRRGLDVLSVPADRFLSGERPQPIAVSHVVPGFERLFMSPMPDGRLVGVDGPATGATRELRVVFNWFDELRQRAP
jgi:Tol biopolymer transport system component